jgi:hypothetical protein
MPHPLVLQLRFTRTEFKRAIARISEEDARKRVMPMNSVSWTVGHLAWQEQRYFIYFPTGELLLPEIQERYAFGAPHRAAGHPQPATHSLVSVVLPKPAGAEMSVSLL